MSCCHSDISRVCPVSHSSDSWLLQYTPKQSTWAVVKLWRLVSPSHQITKQFNSYAIAGKRPVISFPSSFYWRSECSSSLPSLQRKEMRIRMLKTVSFFCLAHTHTHLNSFKESLLRRQDQLLCKSKRLLDEHLSASHYNKARKWHIWSGGSVGRRDKRIKLAGVRIWDECSACRVTPLGSRHCACH